MPTAHEEEVEGTQGEAPEGDSTQSSDDMQEVCFKSVRACIFGRRCFQYVQVPV